MYDLTAGVDLAKVNFSTYATVLRGKPMVNRNNLLSSNANFYSSLIVMQAFSDAVGSELWKYS